MWLSPVHLQESIMLPNAAHQILKAFLATFVDALEQSLDCQGAPQPLRTSIETPSVSQWHSSSVPCPTACIQASAKRFSHIWQHETMNSKKIYMTSQPEVDVPWFWQHICLQCGASQETAQCSKWNIPHRSWRYVKQACLNVVLCSDRGTAWPISTFSELDRS